MAHIDRVREDAKIEAMQEASAALCIGVLFLAVSGIAGIFAFQSLRSGTMFWLDYIAVLGGIGVILTGLGVRGRHHSN